MSAASAFVRRALRATVLVAALLVVGSLSSAAAAPRVAQPGIAAIRFAGEDYPRTNLPQYATVFLGPARSDDLEYIKRYGPNTRVLQWNNITYLTTACGDPTPPDCAAAVSYSEALAHDRSCGCGPREQWILRDAAGQPIGYKNYPKEYYANPASSSYQQRARSNLLRSLTASSPQWDGVNLDDIEKNYYNSAGNPIHGTNDSPLYPNNASYTAAFRSLLDYVGPYLRQRGFYLAGNAAVANDVSGSETRAWWADLADDFDGYTQEYFEQHGNNGSLAYNGNVSDSDYNDRLNFPEIANSLGKDFFGGMHYDRLCDVGPSCTLSEAMMYGMAAFRLTWDGGGGGYRMQQTGLIDPWNAAWTKDIGRPAGGRYRVAGGWRRDYTEGTVIVNPNAPGDGAITFNLGASYVDPNGNRVRSVTLRPVSAMILSKSESGEPPPSTSYYNLVARQSGKCLDITGGSDLDGTNAIQWSCNGGDNQRWRLVASGGGYSELVARDSGKCLDIEGGSDLDGANAIQWSCNGGDNQRWRLVATGDGYYQLAVRDSGKCLDIAGGSDLDAANAIQWTCNGGNKQQWRLVPAG
jgi:hypothetical protein